MRIPYNPHPSDNCSFCVQLIQPVIYYQAWLSLYTCRSVWTSAAQSSLRNNQSVHRSFRLNKCSIIPPRIGESVHRSFRLNKCSPSSDHLSDNVHFPQIELSRFSSLYLQSWAGGYLHKRTFRYGPIAPQARIFSSQSIPYDKFVAINT